VADSDDDDLEVWPQRIASALQKKVRTKLDLNKVIVSVCFI